MERVYGNIFHDHPHHTRKWENHHRATHRALTLHFGVGLWPTLQTRAYLPNDLAIELTHLGGPPSYPSGTKESRLLLVARRDSVAADADAASYANAAVATCGHGASPLPPTLMRDQQSHPSTCLVVHAKGG